MREEGLVVEAPAFMQEEGLVVGAPAFMRGEERFSAP
jgi:hypothetical protein